jgi:Zn-finger nucleic acid-binding protein
MAELICPTCDAPLAQAGYTFRCATCEGAWIQEEVLVGLLQERASTLVELSWQPRVDVAPRPCAACRQPMDPVSLGTVALDRCASHGVWFDSHELAGVLAQKDKFKAGTPPHHAGGQGLWHRLAKLIGA